jgi:predicted alpha/beta-hydrolase family hydrolase
VPSSESRAPGPGSDQVVDVETSLGLARAHCAVPTGAPSGRLLLGHGAGGGVGAKDLLAARSAALAAGWAVARIEQPWRVAGKRVAAPPPRLDTAWLEVADSLFADVEALAPGPPLVLGGRSAGARVACRTAAALAASGVLCRAFPLHPPGKPERSRADALGQVPGVPLLVVQGRTDPFGTPDDVRAQAPSGTQVVGLDGDHGLAKDLPGVRAAVSAFLAGLESASGGS